MGMALPLSCTLAGVHTGTMLLPASFSEYCWSHGITCALALYLQHNQQPVPLLQVHRCHP